MGPGYPYFSLLFCLKLLYGSSCGTFTNIAVLDKITGGFFLKKEGRALQLPRTSTSLEHHYLYIFLA
jgi:hypothetical protein